MDDWTVRAEDGDTALANVSVRQYERTSPSGRPEVVHQYQRQSWWIPHPDWLRGEQRWITAGEAAWRQRGEEARAKARATDAAEDAAEKGGQHVVSRQGTSPVREGGAAAARGVVGQGTEWERPVHGYERPDPERLVNPKPRKGQYARPEDHPFFKQVPVSKENIKAAFKEATPSEKYQGRRWYPDAHRLAWALGGGDAQLGALMLSAYSPRSGWPVNMFNAARSLARGKAIGPGEGLVMGLHQNYGEKILAGERDVDKALPSPKTNAFARLIAAGIDHPDDPLGQVVVDAHAMSVAAGRRLTKEEGDLLPIDKQQFYAYVADKYREAAADLSEETGQEVSPSELQAITWLVQQRRNTEADTLAAEAGDRAAKGRLALQKSMGQQWRQWEQYAREHGHGTQLGTTAMAPVPITAAEARGDSRPVSAAEFHQIATRGRDLLNASEGSTSPLTGLAGNFDALKSQAWDEVQQPWGGMTIDAHTGEPLASDADKYALSVKPPGMSTISVPDTGSQKQFDAAMSEALVKFRAVLEQQGYYLGIFHDDANHRIDIDPVMVVDNRQDAEAIGAYTHNVGGAYHFASGNGFWPPHIVELRCELVNRGAQGRLPGTGRHGSGLRRPVPEARLVRVLVSVCKGLAHLPCSCCKQLR